MFLGPPQVSLRAKTRKTFAWETWKHPAEGVAVES